MPIVITPGEPAGIGPEICLQFLASPRGKQYLADSIIIADADLLASRAQLLGIDLPMRIADNFDQAVTNLDGDRLSLLQQKLPAAATCG